MDAFPIVVGCGRSGTTLLRAMFDAHPDLAMMYESRVLPGLARRRTRYERPAGFNRERFLHDVYRDRRFPVVGLPRNEAVAALRSSSVRTLADAVRRLFATHPARAGKARYGDKTPYYVLWLPLLADLLPEARFVHVIRDGRDVALSLREMRFGPTDAAQAAFYWRRRVSEGRHAGRQLGPAQYVEVRYEQLVVEPEAVVRRLCRFVDLDFDPAMLRYYDDPRKAVASTGLPEQHRSVLLPPTPGLRDWRREMSAADCARFTTVAGRLLADLGYEVAARPSTRPSIAPAWAGWSCGESGEPWPGGSSAGARLTSPARYPPVVAFRGWPVEAVQFFEGLEADNSKAFWLCHKDVYEGSVRAPMEELLAELAPDFGPGRLFRPYRDVRFSKDKTAYKTSIAALVGSTGYVALSADGLNVGAGMVHMEPNRLERYRKAVDDATAGPALEAVVAAIRDQGHECGAHEALKTAPKGYPKDHPRIDLLRAKGLIMWHQWPVAAWLGTAKAKDRIVKVLQDSEPLRLWLAAHVGADD